MKNWVPKTFLPAAGILILAALPCLAQSAIVPAPGGLIVPGGLKVPAPAREVRLITLRNVPSNLIAWWLDPNNHPQPRGFTSASPPPGLVLPAGIDRIIASAPNQIIAIGTAEAVRELQDILQFLDRPSDKIQNIAPQQKIAVEARLLTIKIGNLGGIWAALAGQTGRGTPAAAFLKPDEELELGGQIARLEARFERNQRLNLDSGAAQILDFGSPPSPSPMRPRDFSSQMPVIPPPQTGDEMRERAMRPFPRALLPFNALQLQVQPTLQSDGAVSLELRDLARGEVLGRAGVARFEMRAGESLVLALPDSTLGTRAFLLFGAANIQPASASKIPLIGDLPLIGELFRLRNVPPTAP